MHKLHKNGEGEPQIIGVVGPTAAGKTTLLDHLRVKLADLDLTVHDFPELSPEDNRYFAAYCAALSQPGFNPHAFDTQMTFAEHAFGQANKIGQLGANDVALWGVGPWGHFMYALRLTQDERMAHHQFESYCAYFFESLQEAPVPNVIVAAMVESADTLRQRIIARAEEENTPERRSEIDIPIEHWLLQIEYWQELVRQGVVLPLEALHQMGFDIDQNDIGQQIKQIPLLSLAADQIDWRTSDGINQAWNLVQKYLVI